MGAAHSADGDRVSSFFLRSSKGVPPLQLLRLFSLQAQL